MMSKRERLSEQAIEAFVSSHPGWAHEGSALTKTFTFDDYAAGVGFVVRVGFAAEKRDHHPDLHVGYCKVKVSWSTHDAGASTGLDAEMAELSDQLHKR
jgi:4a-hydroxytetrahydrobiopterin dehydratase